MKKQMNTEPSFDDQHIYFTKKDFHYLPNNFKKSFDSTHTGKILSSPMLPEIFQEDKTKIPIHKKRGLIGNSYFLFL